MKEVIKKVLEEVSDQQLNLASEAGREYLAHKIWEKMVPTILFEDDSLLLELDTDVDGVPYVSLGQWEPLTDDSMEAKDLCTWGAEDIQTIRALANALLTAARSLE